MTRDCCNPSFLSSYHGLFLCVGPAAFSLDQSIPLLRGQLLPCDLFDLFHCSLGPRKPLPGIDNVVNRAASPHRHVHDHGIIHARRGRIRSAHGEHGQHDAVDKEGNGRPGNGQTEPAASVKRARGELVTAPDGTRKDRKAPRQVVARHGEGEERRGCGRRDQAEQAEDDGGEHGAPDGAQRDVPKPLGLEYCVTFVSYEALFPSVCLLSLSTLQRLGKGRG